MNQNDPIPASSDGGNEEKPDAIDMPDRGKEILGAACCDHFHPALIQSLLEAGIDRSILADYAQRRVGDFASPNAEAFAMVRAYDARVGLLGMLDEPRSTPVDR